ncbi:hypothetical protein K505DRAFT_375515 [Melanomma pulvis-pyrius CBS 109.77]|uniref:GPI inositol-deacylase n=1 Tax=Melanomma pulvis-pyrius CBS 109.77 TaxID=1314802 RepID=A0A6A6X9T4_9PLEO|nr:hypothetical protein K505DRAFT_375515 [Melanomma pulvis-pyrius CBS 109.77]
MTPTSARSVASHTKSRFIKRKRSTSYEQEDKGPLGLTVIHEPSKEEAIADLVFVHGLGGGSRATWTKGGDPNLFWPQEWLPNEPGFENIRIHTFGYDAMWTRQSTLNIFDFAQSLLSSLSETPSSVAGLPLFLIGHSVGGLVIKMAYLLARKSPEYSAIADRLKAILFLATPHRGSSTAELLLRIVKITSPAPAYVANLHRHSQQIQSINEEFGLQCQNLQLYSFYETQTTRFGASRSLVVEKSVAVLGYTNEHVQMIDAGHDDMCKFTAPNDSNYIIVRNSLVAVINAHRPGFLESNRRPAAHRRLLLDTNLGVFQAPESRLIAASEKRLEGSCRWLLGKDSFMEWRDNKLSDTKVYWIRGAPGTGKSVLAGFVIDHLRELNLDCSFYFFSHGDKNISSIASFLRMMVWQMADLDPEILQMVLKVGKEDDQLGVSDHRILWRKLFLNGILKVQTETQHYWVIDALDECADAMDLLSYLLKILETTSIRILLTSRSYPSLLAWIWRENVHVTEMELDAHNTHKDIAMYINSRLPHNFDDLAASILVQSAGSFLWTTLVLDQVEQCYSMEDIRNVIEGIPSEMGALYIQILQGMAAQPHRSKLLVQAVLVWVCCCDRPLTVDELSYALYLDMEIRGMDIPKFIASTCSQLIIIDAESRVRFIHRTARDFVLGPESHPDFMIDIRLGHERLAMTCLKYLLSSEMKVKKGHGVVAKNPNPFVNYASTCLYRHILHASSDNDKLISTIATFLTSSNILSWIEYLAQEVRLDVLIGHGEALRRLLQRRAKYAPPLTTDAIIIGSWAVDLVRLAARFGQLLISNPLSIYSLIPPFCPRESAIFKQFANGSGSIEVSGLPDSNWDDCLSTIRYSDERACAIACSDNYFAIGLSRGRIIVYNASSCQETVIIEHGEPVRVLYFGSTSSLNILTSAGARSIKVWDATTWTQRFEFPTNSPCMSLGVSEPNSLVAALRNNQLVTWDLQRGELTTRLDWTEKYDNNTPHFYSQLTYAALCLDSDLLAIAYRNRDLLLYDVERDEVKHIFSKEAGEQEQHLEYNASRTNLSGVQSIAFSPNSDASCIAILYEDGNLLIYDVLELALVAKAIIHARVIAVSPNASFLATGDYEGTIEIFELDTLRLLYRLTTGGESITSLAFSLDSQRLIDVRADSCNIWQPNILLRPEADPHEDVGVSESILEVPQVSGVSALLDAVLVTAIYTDPQEQVIFVGKDDGSVWIYTAEEPTHPQWLFSHAYTTSVTFIIYDRQSGMLLTVDASMRITCRHIVRETDIVRCGHPFFDMRVDTIINQVIVNDGHSRMLVSSPTSDALYMFDDIREPPVELLSPSSARATLSPTQPTAILPRNARTAYTWTNHPILSNTLALFEDTTVHLYKWADLERLTPKAGIHIQLDTAIPPEICVRSIHAYFYGTVCVVTLGIVQGHRNSSRVLLLNASDLQPNSDIAATTSSNYLANQVEYIIGYFKTRLIFLDTSGWICSATVKRLQIWRHFFLPASWLNTGHDLIMDITYDGSLVFIKQSEVVIIKKGLDFDKKDPKMDVDLTRPAQLAEVHEVDKNASHDEKLIHHPSRSDDMIIGRVSNARSIDLHASSDDSCTNLVDYETDQDSLSSRDTRSVSMTSRQTYGTNITDYSARPKVSVEAELANLLSNHESFQPLYIMAMSNPDIGPDRFSREFSRLLKSYARELKKEAKNQAQIAAAQLVHARFQFIAQSIRRRYDPNAQTREGNMLPELTELPVQSRAETVDRFLDETYGSRGLQGGAVGEILPVASIRYIHDKKDPPKVRATFDESSSTRSDPNSELGGQEHELDRFPQDFNSMHEVKIFLTSGESFNNLRRCLKEMIDPDPETITPSNKEEEAYTAEGLPTLRVIEQRIRKLAIRLDLLEGPPPPGYERIEWACACGEIVHDDFLELRVGALDELKAFLASSNTPHTAAAGNTSSPSASGSIGVFANIFSMFSSFRTSKSQKTLPTNNTTPNVNNAKQAQGTPIAPAHLYLLSCLDHGSFGVKLHHELLTDVKNDRSLFRFLRDTYAQRQSMRSWLSLKTIRSLNLVRFSVDMSEYVDIKWHHDNCSGQCSCLPPQRIVEPSTSPEYRCQPVPASYIPPMGKNYLMHYMRHPQILHPQQTWVYNQLPKRLCGQLLAPNDEQVTGWGMHFEEGINWRACGILGFTVIVVGSCAFGIIWAIMKEDVQTGFTVAAYWSNIATVVLGFFAVRVAVRIER